MLGVVARLNDCRNIAITLIDPDRPNFSMSVIACFRQLSARLPSIGSFNLSDRKLILVAAFWNVFIIVLCFAVYGTNGAGAGASGNRSARLIGIASVSPIEEFPLIFHCNQRT